MALLGIYGASGFGREVMPLAHATRGEGTECVFIDDAANGAVNGHPCITYAEFRARGDANKRAVVAIANSKVRQTLTERLLDDGIALATVAAANSVSGDGCDVAAGAILCSFVTLTSNMTIGRGFHANLYSYVAHDCVIGDYVTFAPGVMCNGNIMIEDHAYVGTGAILKQGVPGAPTVIGAGAVIGMGAVVTKSVAPGVTVVGNPAKPFGQ